MGRPKEHNEQTAIALLDAAERIVEREGMAGGPVETAYGLFADFARVARSENSA